MAVLYLIIGAILLVSVTLSMVRAARGPSVPDRAIAFEVMLTVAVGGIAVHAAFERDNTALPIMLVVSLLGFVGAVCVARFTRRGEPKQ